MEIAVFVGAIVINLLMASVVYKNNSKSATNIIFIFLSLATIGYLISVQLSLSPRFIDNSLFWIRMSIFFAPYQTIFLFLLAHTLPYDKIQLSRKKLILVVFVTIAISLINLTPFSFKKVHINNGIPSPVQGPGLAPFAISTVMFYVLALFSLIKKMKLSEGLIKQQVKYVTYGIVTMLGLIIFTILIPVIFFRISSFVKFAPVYALIFLGMTTYAIIKHRFMDIRLLVARTISYSVLLALVIIMYTLLLYGLTEFVPNTQFSQFVPVILALVVAFSFNPMRLLLEKATDRLFFKGRYDTEKLLSRLTRIMAQELDFKRLTSRLMDEMVSQMKITKAAFVMVKDHKVIEAEVKGFDEPGKFFDYKIEELLHHDQEAYTFEELDDEETKELYREKGIAVVLPLKVKQSEIGLFVLGPKASGEVYNSQDIGLLEIFAPQVSISIQNAQSYREIQSFSLTLEKKVEERTLELELTQKRELAKANELLKIKDEFVFIATHDLRTPVTAIRGYVDIIKHSKEALSDVIKHDFDAIMEASDRLNQLVNDLLQVARNESGTIKVMVEPVNLSELVQKTLREVELTAQKRNIQIKNELDRDQYYVMADKDKLVEVLENLFSNGIKYNRDNGTLSIKAKEEGGMRMVSISDTGYGIPQADQGQVFQKFFKSRTDETREIPGTGLGLFVVRMLLEKMGGSISFESIEGEGTTFTFKLPSVRIG